MTVCSTLTDAGRLDDTVVVIDVFRSSNTIIALLANGASRVVPVKSVDEARALKRDHPDWLLLAERKGVRLPDTDGDNSPANTPTSLAGRTVILTTSGGTKCIAACCPQQKVYVGSFANAAALTADLRRTGGKATSFWAVGRAGEWPAEEDEECARYLDGLWNGSAPAFDAIRSGIEGCPGADRLRGLGQHQDLAFCLALNSHALVPRRVPFQQDLWCFEHDALP